MSTTAELARWLEKIHADGHSPSLGDVKAWALSKHVNARGWRLYTDYGDAMFHPLANHWFRGKSASACAESAMAWLCVVQSCEMDVLPPLALVQSLHEWSLPNNNLGAIPPLFLRAAWKALTRLEYDCPTQNGDEAARFVTQQVVPVARWFFQSGAYKQLSSQQLKAGWSKLQGLYREHLQTQSKEMFGSDWPHVVKQYASGPFVLVALCDEPALKAEGTAMNHCVGSYADTCREEPIRIFSIKHKKSNERVATLSVKEGKPGRREVDQLKGPFNAKVTDLVWPEIEGLLRLMDSISTQDKRLRNYLDAVHHSAA